MPSPVINTAKGPLVLLFYDGYEWRARQGFFAAGVAQARRLGRYTYRTLLRKQVHTGFYTAFLALRAALERNGCDVRVNDFTAALARPDYPVGLGGYPSVLKAVTLPNPVVFGPGDFGVPADAVAVAASSRIQILIQPSDWFRDYYRSSCGEKVVTWYAGIDTAHWTDQSSHPKSVDVLIYDKIRWYRDERVATVRDRLIQHLTVRGFSWKIIRYGHHHQKMFVEALRLARSMAFLCEHETQGLAYQEALASGVPVFAWDDGEFVDPALKADAPPGLKVSSVPYFDERCGRRFTLACIEAEFDCFWAALANFRPRDYVLEALSMEKSAQAYLDLYVRAGSFPSHVANNPRSEE
jgi:glycosyltransferase involved in cell wall biosynthesis